MPAPLNTLKRKLLQREPSLGCWLTLASPAVAEALAHCGFDWLVVDTEHGPGDVQNVAAQLQAIDAARANGASAQSAVRVAWNDPVLVKRIMDCGAQTVVFPVIETADEAARAVAATRYPQQGRPGIRGVAGIVRAGTYGLDADYLASANEQICTIVQIETAKGLANVEAIAATEGIDCLFVGPADLAANLGHLGNSSHVEVQTAIARIVSVSSRIGKSAGIFAADADEAKRYRAMGISFISLNSDVVWLTSGARTALGALSR